MVKILFILLFLPFICSAQGYIGASKADVETYLKKASMKYELSPVPLEEKYIQYQEQDGSVVKLFIKNDTISYYKILSDKKLNKVKQYYDEEFYIASDWIWLNHVPHKGSFLYTIEFPEKSKAYITTVQRIK